MLLIIGYLIGGLMDVIVGLIAIAVNVFRAIVVAIGRLIGRAIAS